MINVLTFLSIMTSLNKAVVAAMNELSESSVEPRASYDELRHLFSVVSYNV